MPELKIGNLRLNNADNGEAKDRIASAEKRKAAATETLEEGFDRILAMKLSDRDRFFVKLAQQSIKTGKIGRMKDGKLSKVEAVQLGKQVDEENRKAAREERMADTLATKPDNYYIITNDADLPAMVERLREEVRLQQSDEWFREVFRLFNGTHIRKVLTERGVDLPEIMSFTEWDTETSGTDTMIDMSGGYSFWLPILNEGYYVAYGHLTDDPQCSRSAALEAIRKFIESPSQAKAFHNTPFDYAMFDNDGLKPKGFRYDSMDAAQLMNEHEESNGLKPLFTKYKKYLGGEHLDDYTFEDLFGNGSPMPYSPEVVGIYAIKDVEKGWLLTKWQIEMMRQYDLLTPYFEIRQYLYEVNTTIERTGFVINVDRMRELEAEYEPKLQQAIEAIIEAYNIDDEFIRKMDRKINAKKIDDWIEAQDKRILRKQEQITKKQAKVTSMEKDGKTETKAYANEKAALEKYQNELSELAEPAAENAPVFTEEFNLNSGDHLGYLIYDVLQIEDKTKLFDKKKERATNKKVLDLYLKEEAALRPLDEYSKLSTLLGTFIKKIPNALDSDGRLHTRLKTVSTGRYSSSGYGGKPTELWRNDIDDDNFLEHMALLVDTEKSIKKGTNLQNIPSRTEEGTKVRMMFEPPEGYTFIGSDLSSIEPRIQAHRMATEFGDEIFAEMYRKGLDPYVEFAAILFDVPKEYCTEAYYKSVKGTPNAVPAYRKAMKQMFLAIGYGQAFDMFYKGVIPFGIGEEQAKIAYDKFDEILPGFKGMVEATFEHLRQHGWTATIFGQKRRFPGYIEKYKRLCVLMKRAGIADKNDPELGKKTNKLKYAERSEFWDLMRFTGGCERAAFNHTIQGSGANILQMCMIRSYYECTLQRCWEFVLTLHDEQKHAIPNDQLTEEAIELYDDIMTNTYNLVLPLACDSVIEPRWMEEYGRDEWDFENCKPKLGA
ncbi:DNA polymerase [Terribacillus saccharophilus]|uniref:DNA polymerase n=1 Tax=Terribacillus saccharophilus TaxID=361277 RepID=UPI003D29C72D